MIKYDFYFYYKYTVRFMLLNKLGLGIKNTHEIPYIKKLLFYFSVNKVENIDDVQGYNYFYLFKFFLGRKAFLSRYKSFFSLGKWTYSFNVNLFINNKALYDYFYFYMNDFLCHIDSSYLSSGIHSPNLKVFYISLKDMNVFSEKKTNLGLFYLKNNLELKLFCEGVDVGSIKVLFKNLKLKKI